MDLPTVEQCVAFRATINRGRKAIDLPALEYLDFDGAEPANSHACLSATNLFASAGYVVLWDTVEAAGATYEPKRQADDRVTVILEAEGRLPDAILDVTDAFDWCGCLPRSREQEAHYKALRARLVEAGVVAP